ncbi:FecCD family ABC transporter permease [Nitrosococcus oceani]|uniref:Transport system permease protein n=2 Tax=Nitrosococcus oceani TaxID=1229 RepID=Q3JCU5_NITOC|nr:iron ABC transporter permease [Nitrosococcus oceani]KFI20328.1 iron ABC transporter [Nitrosococcus oceani C-27]ABA57351.1 transport system permease protein [Nitrosococcus oceani ATCC 19707]EDZ67269.1 ABC transporter, FeCT family, permease protein [Nitrosococcus oceani AFC27]KFI23429.1 iron ABC transporter [Nitrosococcus oceani]GEM20227.1 iron ABC transporter [Nitrosococcus oceani]
MKPAATLGLLALLAIGVLSSAPFLGLHPIPVKTILESTAGNIEAEIFWNLRVPRVMAAFLAGAGLAVSGMSFQALFRNPLATPFTLGVASGAALGAALYLRLGLSFALFNISGLSLSAFAGALGAILLVYGLTQVSRGFSAASILLAGVAISFFFSSLILFIQYLSDFTQSFHILRWLMGSLSIIGIEAVFEILPFVIGGTFVILLLSQELNLLATGELLAASRGLNVRRIRSLLFFVTSLTVGGIVAICGPIGFVGMMVPHICRLLVGADHRFLAPATLLFGGSFLVLCDTLARNLIAPAEIPVGVITALLGGPFFMWLLLKRTLEKSII